jgi:hypothetical protein
MRELSEKATKRFLVLQMAGMKEEEKKKKKAMLICYWGIVETKANTMLVKNPDISMFNNRDD